MGRDSCDAENFQDTLKRFSVAENFIKEVELCASAIAFPAINQLRYAGHHLLKALASDDQAAVRHEVDDVRDHCHRAMYEASEAGIGYLIELLKTFELTVKHCVRGGARVVRPRTASDGPARWERDRVQRWVSSRGSPDLWPRARQALGGIAPAGVRARVRAQAAGTRASSSSSRPCLARVWIQRGPFRCASSCS